MVPSSLAGPNRSMVTSTNPLPNSIVNVPPTFSRIHFPRLSTPQTRWSGLFQNIRWHTESEYSMIQRHLRCSGPAAKTMDTLLYNAAVNRLNLQPPDFLLQSVRLKRWTARAGLAVFYTSLPLDMSFFCVKGAWKLTIALLSLSRSLYSAWFPPITFTTLATFTLFL